MATAFAPARRRRLRKRWVAVTGVAAVGAAAIWLVIHLRDGPTAGPGRPPDSPVASDAWELVGELGRVVSDGVRSGLAAIGTRVGSEPEPPAVEDSASPSDTPARGDQTTAPSLSDASPGTTSAVGAAGSPPRDAATSAPARDGGLRGVSQEDEVAEVAGSEPAARIYSAHDIGVTPPVTVRPQFPTLPPPGVPADALGVIEVIVSDAGEVESVKLLSPPRNLNERLILSAVKAWQFWPAMKDGRAVRFRHLIQITLP